MKLHCPTSHVISRIYNNLPEVRKRREEERRRAQYDSYRLNAQLYNKVGLIQADGADRKLICWNLTEGNKCLRVSENHQSCPGQKNCMAVIKNKAFINEKRDFIYC